MRTLHAGLALLSTFAALLAGCASDGYSSSSNVSVGASFYYGHSWYNDPDYWYGDPDYIVVPPDRPDRPGEPGEPGAPVRPEQPIANTPGASQLPTQRPSQGSATLPSQGPSQGVSPSASSRSRMPAAQPRMSSPSSRASIPRALRGGGGGGRRR